MQARWLDDAAHDATDSGPIVATGWAAYVGLEGRCKATWEREFKLPWREAGPPNHHEDTVDSDQ